MAWCQTDIVGELQWPTLEKSWDGIVLCVHNIFAKQQPKEPVVLLFFIETRKKKKQVFTPKHEFWAY